MILPALFATLPVLLGLILALAARALPTGLHQAYRPLLALATAVVLVLMLPGAFARLGWAALGVFLPALLVPAIVERIAGHRHGHGHGDDDGDGEPAMDADLGLAGLLLHQVVEGAEIAALSVGDARWMATALLLSLHTVPLVAAVLVKSAPRVGRRGVLGRGSGLLFATLIGLVVGAFAGSALEGLEPWVQAAAGGLILHAMWHGWAHPRR